MIYLYTKEEEEEVPIEEGDEDEEEEEEEEEAEGEEEEEIRTPRRTRRTRRPRRRRSRRRFRLGAVNDAKALWTRNPSDITDEEYKSFYQSLTKDFGEPLTHTHFSAEGEVEFVHPLHPQGGADDLYNDYSRSCPT